MSSYVVEKERFVKAAGILAGIAEATRGCIIKMHLYDYENERVMGSQDYYDRFVECFVMNSLSVQEQYHEESPWTDDNDYKNVFAAYMQRGKALARNRDQLRKMIYELVEFFREVEYQTEKPAYMFKMQLFFGNITRHLLYMADPYNEDRRRRQMFDI